MIQSLILVHAAGEFGKVYRGFLMIRKPYLPAAIKTLKV